MKLYVLFVYFQVVYFFFFKLKNSCVVLIEIEIEMKIFRTVLMMNRVLISSKKKNLFTVILITQQIPWKKNEYAHRMRSFKRKTMHLRMSVTPKCD